MKSNVKNLLIVVLCFAYFQIEAQQLHNDPNAASINNETNATTGWITTGTLLTSDTSNPYHGTYALRAEAAGTSDAQRKFRYLFSAVVGEVYDISIWARTGSQNVSPAFAAWTGVSGFINPTIITTGTVWSEYTFTVTATSTTAGITIYTGSASNGVIGDVLFIDRVSIIAQSVPDTQNPNPPLTVSNATPTTNSVSLTWSGATDNIGVTGYKVFKAGVLEATLGNTNTYSVTGLSAETTYQFTVAALDAAGNESTQSTALSVTTASSGGGSTSSVWDTSGSTINYAGNVGIGTTTPGTWKLAVNGNIRAKEIKVESANWPDYVFAKDYNLPTLAEIQRHIQEKGHLPGMPSAAEAEANGVALGEMNRLLLEKVEELTLYIINLKQELNKKQRKIDGMESLEKRINLIENYLKQQK